MANNLKTLWELKAQKLGEETRTPTSNPSSSNSGSSTSKASKSSKASKKRTVDFSSDSDF